MKKIRLSNGRFALVDDKDFDRVNAFRWYFHPDGYAISRNKSMHRFILNAPKGMVVDHKNHDTLDNRRKNIWICTHSQNSLNNVKRYPHLVPKYNRRPLIKISHELDEEICDLRKRFEFRLTRPAYIEMLIRHGITVMNRIETSKKYSDTGESSFKK